MARTDTLGHFLSDVADAIRTAEGSSDTITASDFDTRIEALSGGGSYAPKYLLFRDYTGSDLEDETANLDTSNMTTMKEMFRNCTNLTTVDISGWDTENVTTMQYMFYDCKKLTGLDVSGWKLNSLTNASYMFYNCWALTGSISFGNTDISNCTTFNNMFYTCSYLTYIKMPQGQLSGNIDFSSFSNTNTRVEEIDLSGITFSNGATINLSNAFNYNRALQKLDIRGFDTSKITSYSGMLSSVPTTCLIIVGTDTDKSWFASHFSSYTNVQTVAEYEAE